MLRKRFLFIMLAALVALSAKGGKPVRICVEAAQGDATRLLQQAIGQASEHSGKEVVIELQNADYHLYRQSAMPKLYHVSNTTSEQENPDATKHIGLWMKGLRNLTIDGRGARLVTHGEMTAFVIDSCKNIRLRNFTLTAADPTVPEMTVTEDSEHQLTARIHPQSRYRIEDGRLSWYGHLPRTAARRRT